MTTPPWCREKVMVYYYYYYYEDHLQLSIGYILANVESAKIILIEYLRAVDPWHQRV